MTAYEMMLSESQERMLVILKPGREPRRRRSSRSGASTPRSSAATTDTGRMIVKHKGEVVADLPLPAARQFRAALRAPVGRRAALPRADPARVVPAPPTDPRRSEDADERPDLCSKRWIWEQYDHMVMGDTIGRPGADAGIVRVHGTKKGLAIDLRRHAALCRRRPL